MDGVRIPLGRSGLFAVVDLIDAYTVSKYRWYPHKKGNNVYARTILVREDGSSHRMRMHVLIMQPPEGMEVDHKDRDGLNNRRENLRLATPTQNRTNSRQRDSGSLYRGVQWEDDRARWRAAINADGKKIRLGRYKTPEEAARAYDAAARKLHGEFASLNFPDE